MEQTDDLGLSPEFLMDECIARDQDEWDLHHDSGRYGRTRCTCGFVAATNDARDERCYDVEWPSHENFAGCKGCDPVDWECKPYGWGIERHEDPALQEANEYSSRPVILCVSMYRSPVSEWSKNYSLASATRGAIRNARWKANTRQSKRRQRHSNVVWDRICNSVETHRQAVAAYKEWAERAVKIRYRDEEA